jgi:predicted exporter
MAVAGAVFVIDLVRLAPLSTPLYLSRTLLQAGLSLEDVGVLETVSGFSPGGRLAAFTAVHLAVFAVFGMFAAALANLFHLPWNARTGAIAGLLVGAGAWRLALEAGPAWISAGHLTPEIVIGAGIVGGTVLGWHLRLCRLDAAEVPARRR